MSKITNKYVMHNTWKKIPDFFLFLFLKKTLDLIIKQNWNFKGEHEKERR